MAGVFGVGQGGGLTLANAFFDIMGGIQQQSAAQAQAYIQKAQGEISAVQSEINADLAANQALEQIDIGAQQGRRARTEGHKRVGDQRAALAAQGIDVSSGSAQILEAETERLSQADEMAIRNQATRQAAGLQRRAASLRFGAQQARQGASAAANQTLIGGNIRFAQSIGAAGGRVTNYFRGSPKVRR